MEVEKSYYTAEEVAEIIGVKKPTAYKKIQALNKELQAKGYITVAGKINRKYFNERSYLSE
jgi:Mn-dependent DtxR family transcriptional regulator